jgi:acyl phosphate:glycerol-3-phosphate acyltransferase
MSGGIITTALVVAAYLLGSLPFGLLLGKAFTGKDVRDVGSGNIGAANVFRLAGRGVGAGVLLGDMAKGIVPVLIGRGIHLDPIQLSIVAGAAVLGHDFSAFLRFKGGKGVATTIGVCLALAPIPTTAAAVVWVLVLGISRTSSLASLSSLWALPLCMAVFDQPTEYVALAFGLCLLGLFTHRDNIGRMGLGVEHRIGRFR